MDVLVLSKHGQRSLRSAAKAGILGNGLLERVRSTTLALLGATAALGLTMIALALNQGWPLIAGAPIPGFGSEQQAVGKAAVVAKAKARGGRPAISATTRQASPGVSAGKPRRGVTVALAGSRAPQAAGLVASHPTPASPAGEAVPDPTPAVQQPAPAVAPAPAPAPAAVPVSNSSPPDTASEAPGSPIPSQAPPADNEGEEHGHGHTSHGHGHSHGGDPDTPEPTESPETAPDPSEAPAQEAETPGESESEQLHTPSWGHSGGHGHAHW